MNYKLYLSGLKRSIKFYNEAKKKGVIFSRYEKFDSMFKRELAVEENLREGIPFLKKKLISIKNIDYRVAVFYAKFFSELLYIIDEYSFKDIKSLINDIIRYAYINCICLEKFRVSFKDRNNILMVLLDGTENEFEFKIEDSDSLVDCILGIISTLGSLDEKSKSDEEWLYNYLYNEFSLVENGVQAKPYVDNGSSRESLRDYYRKFSREDNECKSRKVVNLYN